MTLSLVPGTGLEMSGTTAVTLLIFVGAMSKSAQFPIHTWLPRSLYAPTPVHALLHAGIINAGGFLLNRLAPLYGLSSTCAPRRVSDRDADRLPGRHDDAHPERHQEDAGLFDHRPDGLHDHGMRLGRLFAGCVSSHRARPVQGHRLPELRQCDPQSPTGTRRFHRRLRKSRTCQFSTLTWSTGFLTTLLVPLVILLATHGVLENSAARIAGDRDLPLLHLGHLLTGHSLADAHSGPSRRGRCPPPCCFTLIFVVFTYLFAAETIQRISFTPIPIKLRPTSRRPRCRAGCSIRSWPARRS